MAVNTDLNTLQIDPDCSTRTRTSPDIDTDTDKPGIATKLEKMLSALPCPYNSYINTTWSA